MNGIQANGFTLTLWQLSVPPPVWICAGLLWLMLYTGKAPRPRSKSGWRSSGGGFFDKYESPGGYWAICFLMLMITVMAVVAVNPWIVPWLKNLLPIGTGNPVP